MWISFTSKTWSQPPYNIKRKITFKVLEYERKPYPLLLHVKPIIQHHIRFYNNAKVSK